MGQFFLATFWLFPASIWWRRSGVGGKDKLVARDDFFDPNYCECLDYVLPWRCRVGLDDVCAWHVVSLRHVSDLSASSSRSRGKLDEAALGDVSQGLGHPSRENDPRALSFLSRCRALFQEVGRAACCQAGDLGMLCQIPPGQLQCVQACLTGRLHCCVTVFVPSLLCARCR